jgi:hypothetical protein
VIGERLGWGAPTCPTEGESSQKKESEPVSYKGLKELTAFAFPVLRPELDLAPPPGQRKQQHDCLNAGSTYASVSASCQETPNLSLSHVYFLANG